MKRWRRPLMLIALLLLAGAVVNVAVAWGIAARAGWGAGFAPGLFQLSGFGWERQYRPGPKPSAGAEPVILSGERRFSCGWPCQALVTIKSHRTTTWVGEWPVIEWVGSGVAGGLEAPRSLVARGMFRESNGRVPLSPIPAGFAINTLFYAALLALPLSFFPIRRRLRGGARRGRCPKCGYDLAGLGGAEPGGEGGATCPECGAAARRRQRGRVSRSSSAVAEVVARGLAADPQAPSPRPGLCASGGGANPGLRCAAPGARNSAPIRGRELECWGAW